ncbi:MAG TPA: formate dehydrogenase accessory protein FdhE [Methylomirabilota bacterium]|nr:formate dehydrogenase accessory protein FdhE [Methylomirabilota bacterium]
MTLDLRAAWGEMLERRRPLAASLAPYGDVLARWAEAADSLAERRWSAAECAASWRRGAPLTDAFPPPLDAADVEDALGAAMEQLARLDAARAPALQRLADAWDAGAVDAAALLPRAAVIGAPATDASGLAPEVVSWLACATLRPYLDAWLTGARAHLEAQEWTRGVCPFCGAPPGFIDVIEGGHRRLACHFCGGAWTFARLRCPLCDAEGTGPLYRLKAEGADEGYVVSGCRSCRGYLKELDRRERWNGGPPLLEDWATPHLDVVARREGYRKPVSALLDLLAF